MRARELVSRDVHSLALGEGPVEYVLLRRRGRRGVGLKVDADGLAVSAPLGISRSRIEGFLRENERWVVSKLAVWRSRKVPAPSWKEGAALPYLGTSVVLRHAFSVRPRVELDGRELKVGLEAHGEEAVRRAVVGWYRRAALAHFAPRTFALARAGGIDPPRVFVSSARARWGSCNAAREVRLAWRLVKARPELVDYVICHELAHLAHMDHSRAFWAEVARLCPGHRALRAELDASDPHFRSF
jgi:hypothetical protein